MKAQSNPSTSRQPGKRLASWRNSTYEEPTWVSVAWILGPVLMAALAIFFVLG